MRCKSNTLFYTLIHFGRLKLRKGLHGKRIETAVYDSHRACYEFCRIAHQIMYRATEFFRVSHSSERSLSDHVLSALGVGAVGVCKQRAVLLRKEESRRYGVNAYQLSKLLRTFRCHESREVADACLCRSISADACQGAESRH